jgi:hypothetical protein
VNPEPILGVLIKEKSPSLLHRGVNVMSDSSGVPCRVFTPDWVAEQQRKYGGRPAHARPKFYHLWTSDELWYRRELIEKWVDELLSPTNRDRVIPKLRAAEQFLEAYNELAVGYSLRQMGHGVQYEVEWIIGSNKLTPDWLVSPGNGGQQQFITEVVSSMPPEERERCDDSWDSFRRRLEDIPVNAFVSLQPCFYDGSAEPVAPPPGSRQKRSFAPCRHSWIRTLCHARAFISRKPPFTFSAGARS